jgi:hypothetical protein
MKTQWLLACACLYMLAACQKDCDVPKTTIRFAAELRHQYSKEPIVGRYIRVLSQEEQVNCATVAPDEKWFSNPQGLATGTFTARHGLCDAACSPFNYFITAKSDSLVCVNSYQPIQSVENKLVFLYKNYVTLELRLRSSVSDVDLFNLQILPESQNLYREANTFHNRTYYFHYRRVDTTILARVLPEERLRVKITARLSQRYANYSANFLTENQPLVRKTVDF